MAWTGMYVLQDVDPVEVGAAPFDVKVVDIYNNNGKLFTPAEVKTMGGGPGASLLLGYFSIGEAETYRDYFSTIPKAALGPENPQWDGNYQVAFWTDEWRLVVTSYLNNVIAAGYDGIYLDVVDEYQLKWAKANDPSGNPAQDMANLVKYIADYAHAISPNFQVWANNAEELLSNSTYFNAIDGMFKENLYYTDSGSKQPVSETQWSLGLLKPMLDAGKPVVAIEYVSSAAKVAHVQAQAAHDGVGYYTADIDLMGISYTGVLPGQVINYHDGTDASSQTINHVSGTAGDDVLTGHTGPDAFDGGSGTDTASYASDLGAVFVNLTLGKGYGNAAEGDTYVSIENVVGTAYNDFLIGDPGVNRLDGGAGNDTIIGALGPDVLIGGAGTDLLSFEDNSGTVFVNLLTGAGFNNAAQGDTFSGFENVIGGMFDDTLIGDNGNNRLDGAMGADTLVGNGGADTFVFSFAPGATSQWGSPNVDTIFDFVSGQDKLEINVAAFGGGLAPGALPEGSFVLGAAAKQADDRFVYDQTSGHLYFDADGSESGAQVLMATFPNHNSISATDFLIA